MEKVIPVALPETTYLSDVVLYVVTKTGQYLNGSQADWLVVSGEVKVDGETQKKPHSILEQGLHTLQVRGRSYTIGIKPILYE